MESYRDLLVWQKSMKLARAVYNLTKLFPKEELYGITSQIRRAVISIPSNIAEGYSRKHRQEYSQFVRVAFASGAELETQLLLAKDLNFVSPKNFEQSESLLLEVMKMLNKLITSLNETIG